MLLGLFSTKSLQDLTGCTNSAVVLTVFYCVGAVCKWRLYSVPFKHPLMNEGLLGQDDSERDCLGVVSSSHGMHLGEWLI